MNASEFADFFEFYIEYAPGIDDDGIPYNYVVSDNEVVFQDRLIDNVSELADCFDSMLMDYIDGTLEDYGFVEDTHSNLSYYEQAQKWIETECPELRGTDTYEVICCLVNPKLIVDDVR